MMIPAASHHGRAVPCVREAATRFATVSKVSGPVVTQAQNESPLSGGDSERGGALAHIGATTRSSYQPAPTTTPRLRTNSHSSAIAIVSPTSHSASAARRAPRPSHLVLLLHRVECVLADEALALGKIDRERIGIADLAVLAQSAERELHAAQRGLQRQVGIEHAGEAKLFELFVRQFGSASAEHDVGDL